MRTTDIHVSQDGKIFVKGEYEGFTDGDKVYVIENGRSREIGDFEHRSEITTMVLEWKNGVR